MWMLLLKNWHFVVIAILAAAVTMFYNLWQGEVKEFAEFKGAIAVLGQEAEKETKRVNELHDKALKETRDEWNKELPKIRTNAVDNYMRRFPNGLCNGSPSLVPRNAGDPEAPAGTFPERVAPGIATTGDPQTDALISECAKDASKLRSFRSWVAKNNLKSE